MKITKLQLKNIKCFEDVELSFEREGGLINWSLVVGDNGQGKTTILRSLALGLCDVEAASALLAELHGGILRHGEEQGTIKISLQNPNKPSDNYEVITSIWGKNESVSKNIYHNSNEIFHSPLIAFQEKIFAVAYGSDRGITGTESYDEYALVDSLYSLFNYKHQLQNAELGARRVQSLPTGGWEKMQEILKDILVLSPNDKITLEPKGLYVESKWGKVSFNALSDGYRSLTSVVLDFVGQYMLKADNFSLDDISGIFIIDEIEAHLHPRWQRSIIKSLAEKFPKVQFICSTHTPICALGLNDLDCESQLVKVAYVNGYSGLMPFNPKECFRGYRADQILTSELFGLSDTRSRSVEDKLEKYREIYLKEEKDRSDIEKKEFNEIEEELKDLHLWENEADRLERKRLIELLEKKSSERK